MEANRRPDLPSTRPERGTRENPRSPGFLATLVGLVLNAVLCALKLTVGLAASSLALISDGVNSLTDAVSSLAIMVAVSVSHKEADEGHPFGHHRAEPIAGLILAVFAGIAGFEILKAAVVRLYTGEVAQIRGPWPFLVLIVSILAKGGLSLFYRRIGRRLNSPAMLAGAADSQIDVFISLAALIAVTATYAGVPFLDPATALVISFFIFGTGYRIGRKNIDYLMGRSPDPAALREIRELVDHVPEVIRIDDIRAHYVGHYVHVALEITVAGDISTHDSHDLEERVKQLLEGVAWIDRAFIHVNPALREFARATDSTESE
jgi:cation diffusion facilitator family transporter